MKLFRYGAAVALLALGAVASPASAAVTNENFMLRTTGDLVALCDARQGDPQAVAAVQMCQGFLLGVYQYHEAINAGRNARPIFCMPAEGAPNRDTAAQMFVAWSRTHPQAMDERPVDGLTRFATDTWPCRRTGARRAARPAAPATPPAGTTGQPAR